MRGRVAGAVAVCILLFGRTAAAHRIDEYLQATVFTVQPRQVQASMRLIPGVMVSSRVIAEVDSNQDGVFSEVEQRAYAQRVLDDVSVALNGKALRPQLVSWIFPQPVQMREGLGQIGIVYTMAVPGGGSRCVLTVANHHLAGMSVYLMNALVPESSTIRILGQKRDSQQTTYELNYEQAVSAGPPRMLFAMARARFEASQCSTLFHLGVRHIAEGTDHLLFLLALLLPAPLLVSGSRWGVPAKVRQGIMRILGIVTAFTAGHSLTLSLAAFRLVHLPGRMVEVLIAVSILVSAIHALRPLFSGKEAWIAGFFGLVHGLAFAATLDRLGLGLWEKMAGIFAFNLGIEAMQMLVVAALLPSLMLMSRTAGYAALRVGGAMFAAAASVGWIVERLFGVGTPVDAVAGAMAHDAPWIAGGLFLLSVTSWMSFSRHRWPLMRVPDR